jgi:uncharacterized membrane protein
LVGIVLLEWAELLLRWLHVVAGIAWIGSSFYFVHLDASLERQGGLPERAHGEAWQVHGGGFYHMVKYLVAPARLPDRLTWFKWEAYTTLISGFFLLVVLYWVSAELYLVDPQAHGSPTWVAIAASAALLVVGWVVYDLMCKSPLGRDDRLLAAVGYVFLVALAWLCTQLFSGRGAFIQIGSIIGTIMVANVFFVIIPNQRKVVAELRAGREPDPALGAAGKQRSMHNNYLTLPVVFLMIANHYPLAFATRFNWLIVAVVIVVGAVIRHFYNERHAGRASPWWTWAVAAAGVLAIVALSLTGPSRAERAAARPDTPPSFAQVESIVLARCSMCHAERPLWPGLAHAAGNLALDSPGAIRRHARPIYLQAAISDAMPPGNVTRLEPDERGVLAAWYEDARGRR